MVLISGMIILLSLLRMTNGMINTLRPNPERDEPLQYPGEMSRVHRGRSIPSYTNTQAVQNDEGSRIFFPDDYMLPRNGNITLNNVTEAQSTANAVPNFVPEVPERCKQQDYCEGEVPNYPQAYIDEVLLKKADVKYRFNLDVSIPDIDTRRGSSEDSFELCRHQETIINPTMAKTPSGQWMYVVNNPTQPVQGFRGEQCVNPGGPCSDEAYFTEKYNATCQQKMMSRTMWFLGKDGELMTFSVAIPSCCSCIVKVVKT